MRAIIDIVTKNKIAFSLFALALFLRFYKLGAFIIFLGDQGRDAIIIKRIITLEKFPAIGPATSIGHAFLGPFYYYLVAPFLLLFNFNPAGLGYAVAVISMIGIIAAYFLLKKDINQPTALLFTFLTTFSAVDIHYSRFSWNPNPLFIFGFFTIYFVYRYFQTKKPLYAAAAGAFFACSIQLHYLAILLLPSILIFSIHAFLKNKLKSHLKEIGWAISSFILFSAPLIIFDLRHDFINIKNLLQLSSESQSDVNGSYISHLWVTSQAFFQHVFVVDPQKIGAIIFIILLVGIYLWSVLKTKLHPLIQLHFLTVLIYLLSFAIIDSPRYPHYYAAIFFSFFLVLAYFIQLLSKNTFMKMAIIPLCLIVYVFLNAQQYTFLYQSPNDQIRDAKEIADSIIQRKPAIPYQIVALPSTETDGHIRYFLEMDYERPLPADTVGQPKELYVLCHGECQVFGNGQWQIAAFADGVTDTMWKVRGITIYKQVHGNK